MVKAGSSSARTAIESLVWLGIIAAALALDRLLPWTGRLPGSEFTPLQLAALVAGVPAFFSLLTLLNKRLLARRGRPDIEGEMLGRVYRLAAVVAGVLALAYGLGGIQTFGAAFAAFGGMLLGWSLQAPVSGFAAWVLVSLKRPFRPGDRIQLPQLGLTGDVTSVGPMYTTLNQVGGAIGSEEAVGRHILLPNAMLFGQVVINYTVTQ
ncbi:MAG: mechanosensitive ion channel family protein, partial [Planctomycetota bacterium]|nr:mechanosensitive ion channel family protein [Planctomycetota bacterium]